jgi:hypothetical protein
MNQCISSLFVYRFVVLVTGLISGAIGYWVGGSVLLTYTQLLKDHVALGLMIGFDATVQSMAMK